MTREEAIKELKYNKEDDTFVISAEVIDMAIKALEQEPTKNDLGVDCISREQAIEEADKLILETGYDNEKVIEMLEELPPITPQEPRKGEWLRMSDLSEQEDDRYKCSRCENVIHHKNKMDLYTFNSWCGRCGSFCSSSRR